MKQGSGLTRLFAMMAGGLFGVNPTFSKNAPHDSRDTQNKDEGRQNPVYFFGASHQPIFIPSKSQRIKSKRLAKRNAGR